MPEYWLVDGEAHTLERLVLDTQGHYTIVDVLSEGDILRPPTFDSLDVPLAERWAMPTA